MAKPTANADFDTIYLNDPNHSISGNITANDTTDSGPIYLRSLNGSSVGAKQGVDQVTTIEGTYGTFTVSPNGSYTYTLHGNIVEVPAGGLVERVGYKISDGGGKTDFDYLTISIKPQHVKPVAEDQAKIVDGDSVSGDLTSEGNVFVSRVGGENLATLNPHDYSMVFVENNGTTIISGQYGDLHVERGGDYTYVLNDAGHNLDVAATESFQFRIHDEAFGGGDFTNAQTTDVGILKISIPAHSPDFTV